MYKKRSLKFTYEQFSRDTRHAEALKARESSRFKRLSMIRSINDSDLKSDMEVTKSVENEEQKENKPPMSRLEMMFKWKQEKQLKKELESKLKKKPFYSGGSTAKTTADSKNLPNLKSSFIAQSSICFNSSKMVKSKLVNVSKTAPVSKIPNSSKQVTSGIASRIPNSKQTVPASKFANPLNKGPNASSLLRKPSSAVTNIASNINKANLNGKVPYKNDKLPLNKNSTILKDTRAKDSTQPAKQGFTALKPSIQTTKPVKKIGTCLPKPSSSVTSHSKGMPFQSKAQTPVSAVNQKLPTVSKLHPKTPVSSVNQRLPTPSRLFQKTPVSSGPQKIPTASRLYQKQTSNSVEKVPTRKGYCFKKAVTDSQRQQADILKTSHQDSLKKKDGIVIKEAESKIIEESLSEQIRDVTFNADISIIKPAPTSFAPTDFRFEPPAGLNFVFDEDDPYEALEIAKTKFLSRTSTPAKSAEKKSHHNSKESLSNDNLLTDVSIPAGMSMNKSLSPDLKISDLMTPDVQKEENESEKNNSKDKVSDPQSCQELTTGEINKTFDKTANLECSSNEREILCNSNKNGYSKDKVIDDESQPNDLLETEPPLIAEELSFDDDSLLDTVDLSKLRDDIEKQMELMKLEDEENKDDVPPEKEVPKCSERKSSGAIPKRASILKNMSVLNAIAETDELVTVTADTSTKKKQSYKSTPRRSKRISSDHSLDAANNSERKVCTENSESSFTPRRSMRLQKPFLTIVEAGDPSVLSPFKESKPNTRNSLRKSMRLIDLNTPEKGDNGEKCKIPLNADLEKLHLKDTENLDPNTLLMDFDRPNLSHLKGKKVSLLYTPEKSRKSMRKSIRGDLIAFSPAT